MGNGEIIWLGIVHLSEGEAGGSGGEAESWLGRFVSLLLQPIVFYAYKISFIDVSW